MGEPKLTAEQLGNMVMASAGKLPKDQLEEFFIQNAIVSIGVLRGMKGDKFADDFLRAGLNDANPMTVTIHPAQ